jgi:hypothetical protein
LTENKYIQQKQYPRFIFNHAPISRLQTARSETSLTKFAASTAMLARQVSNGPDSRRVDHSAVTTDKGRSGESMQADCGAAAAELYKSVRRESLDSACAPAGRELL